MGVVIGRIKICVIADARRKLHRDIFLRVKSPLAQRSVIAQRRRIGGQQVLDRFPRFPPGGPAESEKAVQRAFGENRAALKLGPSEMARFLENRQIEHELANGYANTRGPPAPA